MDKESKIYNFYLRIKGGWGEVVGKSMYPALKEGWKIKVRPADEDKIKVGDMVVFVRGALVCHRIVGKTKFFRKTYFLHKGDNSYIGGIFEKKDLIGKIVDVVDEDRRRIGDLRWQKSHFNKKIKILSYFYLVMYLLKRCIWADNTNRLTYLINRLCWRFF